MALNPTGLALSLLVTTVALLSLSWITVAARFYTRHTNKNIGFDDWLMAVGLIFYTAASVATIAASYNGVGTHAEFLTDEYDKNGRMWFMFFQIFYVLSTAPIKASICVALLRITTRRVYRLFLYSIIGLAVIATIVTDVAVLAVCKPVAATWDPSLGKCADSSVITNVSWFISAVSIVTDWSCAILPALILWDVQLRWRIKASVAVVLGLGVLASSATLVRLRYLLNYTTTEDYLYGIAGIALWSMIESGVGLIAGSLATLRPLLMKVLPFLGSLGSSAKTGTPGYGAGRQSYKMNTIRLDNKTQNITVCEAGDHEWDRISDSESQKDIIKTNIHVTVTKDVKQTSTHISDY